MTEWQSYLPSRNSDIATTQIIHTNIGPHFMIDYSLLLSYLAKAVLSQDWDSPSHGNVLILWNLATLWRKHEAGSLAWGIEIAWVLCNHYSRRRFENTLPNKLFKACRDLPSLSNNTILRGPSPVYRAAMRILTSRHSKSSPYIRNSYSMAM